nr:phage antirepressor KilAC domain-containing protein [uncultured Mitsuokella sp.]
MYPVDYNGVRVLTTEQLAQAYECEPHQISHNFKNNETKFKAGVHYYKLTGEDLKEFKQELGDDKICQTLKFTSVLYLWTRRGASRHCKMLGTEKAWEMYDALEENYFNPRPKALTPAEQMAQGLLAAQKLLAEKDKRIEEMRPKEIFADAVTASKTSILVGGLAKLIKQQGIDIGQKRLFAWMRENGFLIKSGTEKNMPTQRAMDMKLFEVKEGSFVDGNGVNRITRTTKVTGKGQIYFVNKFLRKALN